MKGLSPRFCPLDSPRFRTASAIREAVRQLIMNLKQRLEAKGVRLNLFQNADELELFLGSRP